MYFVSEKCVQILTFDSKSNQIPRTIPSAKPWTSLFMNGTAIFDLPTRGDPFNRYNVTQTHSIFLKLQDNIF